MSALPTLAAAFIVGVARTMHIINHETGASTLWDPHEEQIAAWEHAEVCKAPIIYKPRAIGISTAFDLDDALWTMICDSHGHRVRTGICLDTDDKAKERIKQVVDFLHQMQADFVASSHNIVFPRAKAEVVAFSAGGQRPAASTQFQRIRWSERGFYGEDAEAAMGPSIGLAAREVTETTIKADGKNAATCKRLWRDPRNEQRKLFFSVQRHSSYRADPMSISEADWLRMQAQGYTQRDAAAWFLTIGVEKCGGSELRAWHEYPQKEEHLWQAGAERVVGKSPPVWEVGEAMLVPSIDGSTSWRVQIRGARDESGDVVLCENSGQLLMALDTSGARGQSRSAIVLIDKRDARIVASFASDQIWEDDLVHCALMLQQRFRSRGEVPLALIEDNGIGMATVHAAERVGLRYAPFHQDEASAGECIVQAKRAIEGLLTDGPAELAEECDELHVEIRGDRTVYKGRKDLIMSYGMCLVHRRIDGYNSPPVALSREMHRHLMHEASARRSQAKPPWGT